MADPRSSQEGGITLSPIACESCRQRKRGCHAYPSKCHYPEKSKRGIPFGYLTKLENRLAETESALCRTLASIVDSQSFESAMAGPAPSSSSWTPRQNKVDRVTEWDNMPLRTSDNLLSWYQLKTSASGSAARADEIPVDPVIPRSVSPQPSTIASPLPDETLMDITQFTAAEADAGAANDMLSEYDGSTYSEMGMSKAETLAKSRENLYF
ncbi:hypothetical protein BN1723_013434 [Verticillium longisporum]|uniref:Zn(2)-C6 fungal-type domain-containing protein n=1 Tax=Verticillium longisporum TaxID=100787 RepID=A0A0G4LLY5_VERLO|nr:hypothetical protein BN1708_013554 [Verticillium longisporum]CRK24962.1 hypothetical protein BN1723_013434 [Verticillium longisporum]